MTRMVKVTSEGTGLTMRGSGAGLTGTITIPQTTLGSTRSVVAAPPRGGGGAGVRGFCEGPGLVGASGVRPSWAGARSSSDAAGAAGTCARVASRPMVADIWAMVSPPANWTLQGPARPVPGSDGGGPTDGNGRTPPRAGDGRRGRAGRPTLLAEQGQGDIDVVTQRLYGWPATVSHSAARSSTSTGAWVCGSHCWRRTGNA